MFWKTGKIPKIKQLLPRHPREWSIVSRLTWIYTFSAFCGLLIASFALYGIFASRLENGNTQFLESTVLVLKDVMEIDNYKIADLKEEIIVDPALYHYYVRVLDKNRHLIAETPNMSEFIPEKAFAGLEPRPSQPYAAQHWITQTHSHKKKNFYLLMTALLQNGEIIEIAKDISKEHDIIDDLRQIVFVILLVGVVVSAFTGILVTRRGLKPLAYITESTQRVSVAQLKERLDPKSWPKELSILASSFNNMLDRIEEGVNRLSQFSGDLAHELRTPINNLIGESEIALSRKRSNEEYHHVIESSLEEFHRISQLIENLLFLAGAENPEAVIQKKPIHIEKLMEDMRDFYEAATEEKQVSLICQGTGIAFVNEVMLRRALSNLISNALRHTPSGGKIILSSHSNDYVTSISVADTGEGIPQKHIPLLFNRFYRVDFARSQQSGGTGLGLAIVKSIVDLHKGKISIKSKPGHGTTITLFFPKMIE